MIVTCFLFFFKQKTAYEIRISDWSSDVCSSDLLSFKTKMHTLSPQVVQGIVHAVDLAEASDKALVIGQLDEPFSAGADLKAMLPAFAQGGAAAVEPIEREMQDMAMRLRYAQVPVVAALAGMALGGGCELDRK